MRLRACAGTFLVLVAAAAASPAACSPDSGLPPGGGTTGTGGGILDDGGIGCDAASDSDGDLVSDTLEGAPDLDTDRDGTPDHLDPDSDDDGVPDADEAANPHLDPLAPGQSRGSPCDALADSDGDNVADLHDLDSDNDGIPDKQEAAYDDAGLCRVTLDCDDDGVIDIIEVAAGTDPADAASAPEDPGLYFVLPYEGGEKTKDFTFSTSIDRADLYFLIDTTASMQPAIDDLKTSLNDEIMPAILNGDPGAVPPIPPIGDAWIGMGTFEDVPWSPYGQPGDHIYLNRFLIQNQLIAGNVAPPALNGGVYQAPASVTSILNSLTAAGGGDGPEATTQALWLAAANQSYAATVGTPPWTFQPVPCPELGMAGAPCFRQGSLPIFVVVTDAAFHNGPQGANTYNPQTVGGTRTYAEAVSALDAIHAKVVGVPVAGGNPGAARAHLKKLAEDTESLYHEAAFGGIDRPLVAEEDVASGEVSTEVVRLIGRLAGAGLHDVTTTRATYDCKGGVDCTGDGAADLEFHNPELEPGAGPFDAAQLISAVTPVEASAPPLPYASLDGTTFYGVRGNTQVTFRVHARNDVVQPGSLLVLRALIRVVTPTGQLLGGEDGIKLVYFVIPESVFVPE